MIQFFYPWNTPTLQIELKSPEFSDSQNDQRSMSLLNMMDGSLRTRITRAVPVKLTLSFIEVSRVKALELRDFYVATLGQKIRYVDYNGVHWSGYMTNEPNVTTTSRGGGSSLRKESNSIQVEFEGSKIT